jgi:hypothetical protein
LEARVKAQLDHEPEAVSVAHEEVGEQFFSLFPALAGEESFGFVHGQIISTSFPRRAHGSPS